MIVVFHSTYYFYKYIMSIKYICWITKGPEVEVRKKAVVSIAGVGEAGGRGGQVDRNDRRPGPSVRGDGRGGGRGGVRRTEGGDIKRSEERDSKRAAPKKDKEKVLPTSIEEMPKLEDKSKKVRSPAVAFYDDHFKIS